MRAVYLDSSAFVKVLVEEPETEALRVALADLGRGSRFVSSALLRVEAMRAVLPLGAEGRRVVREGLRRIDLVAIDDRILETAGLLEPSALRTLDAIHLATALALGDDLSVIVTYDRRMAAGAEGLGLRVLSPGWSSAAG
jgi:predicted nucleic acid-binding protein